MLKLIELIEFKLDNFQVTLNPLCSCLYEVENFVFTFPATIFSMKERTFNQIRY